MCNLELMNNNVANVCTVYMCDGNKVTFLTELFVTRYAIHLLLHWNIGINWLLTRCWWEKSKENSNELESPIINSSRTIIDEPKTEPEIENRQHFSFSLSMIYVSN